MISATAFELEVLGSVSDDYEAPHTITEDIGRRVGRPVSESECHSALLALAAVGYVQAYVYDKHRSRFKAIEHLEASNAKNVWFMATDDSRTAQASRAI